MARAFLIVCAALAAPVALAQTPAELETRVGEIFQRGCALSGCHVGPTPQMNLDLSREHFRSSTVGQPALLRPDLQLIHPGEPDRSYLIMKLEGAEGIVGAPMPFEGNRLSQDEIDTVKAWVNSLAADEGASLEEPTPRQRYAFLGWRAVNLPTNRAVPTRTLLITIGHRFNPRIDTGYETFFGLDGSSIIFLSIGYALTDRLYLNLGRSNAENDVELNAQYAFMRQVDGGIPLSLSARQSINWLTEAPPGATVFRAEAVKLSTQIIVSRAFDDRFGVMVVPGALFNQSASVNTDAILLTLGLGGRWRWRGNMSIIAEWIPILHGYQRTTTFGNQNRFDSWATGFEIATAGHVFQIVLTNSAGLATDHYLQGGDLDIRDGHVRLGFNIFRLINV